MFANTQKYNWVLSQFIINMEENCKIMVQQQYALHWAGEIASVSEATSFLPSRSDEWGRGRSLVLLSGRIGWQDPAMVLTNSAQPEEWWTNIRLHQEAKIVPASLSGLPEQQSKLYLHRDANTQNQMAVHSSCHVWVAHDWRNWMCKPNITSLRFADSLPCITATGHQHPLSLDGGFSTDEHKVIILHATTKHAHSSQGGEIFCFALKLSCFNDLKYHYLLLLKK